MRRVLSVIVLLILAVGLASALRGPSVGAEAQHARLIDDDQVNFGRRYNSRAPEETGASNVVAAILVVYRGLDTLGEVTVLFIAATGLAALLYTGRRRRSEREAVPASLIVVTGCRFVFPLILLFGSYIFVHGHLTPGGGFQGGAIVASGFLLIYLGCRGREPGTDSFNAVESLSGLAFVVIGLIGLVAGGSFLLNFLPEGSLYALISAGIIPLVYVFIGFKVGCELGGIVGDVSGARR
jgi:multicomponent Na+:H+ antiporter subunit B